LLQSRCTVTLERSDRVHRVFRYLQMLENVRNARNAMVHFRTLDTASHKSIVALNRNLDKNRKANKVYISNQGATLWQNRKKMKQRNVAA